MQRLIITKPLIITKRALLPDSTSVPLKGYWVGSGRRTLDTVHKAAKSSKYTGKMLRKLNAKRGVGNPKRVVRPAA